MSNIDDNVVDHIEEVFIEIEKLSEKPVTEGAKQVGVDGASCFKCTEPACCTQSLFVSVCEVLPLARHLRITKQDTPELRQRLFDASLRMEGTDRGEYLDKAIPCVFLENRRCTVYTYRPTRCRTYFVFSDPKQCQPPGGQTVKFANTAQANAVALNTGQNIHKYLDLKETRMRILLGSFPRVLLVVLEALAPGVSFKAHIRKQVWPSARNITAWVEGRPPEAKLVQLRVPR